ncbi:mlr5962 [Mesorhizobium japonicum MAFF 303099]|uniref:Mlr5962 protein n=1 Tax=Mesorhizobium japonicum (strain LMG 29417 / CECT 9101 / MAFF 303099) TaxID=266835 RepID=Q98AK9_RHILO|nr:mlr5962 [Mesorhizobium japonicum MAFF 303099]
MRKIPRLSRHSPANSRNRVRFLIGFPSGKPSESAISRLRHVRIRPYAPKTTDVIDKSLLIDLRYSPVAHGRARGEEQGPMAEAAEFLDVDMDHLAWVIALIASDRFGRLISLSRDSPARLRTRLTVAGETPTSMAMCLPVNRWRRKAMRSATAWLVRLGMTSGRDERSAMC